MSPGCGRRGAWDLHCCSTACLSVRRVIIPSGVDRTTLRALDPELNAHCKGMTENFDFKKLSFVLEAKGELIDADLRAAQSTTRNALRSSLQAAFSLFVAQLVPWRHHDENFKVQVEFKLNLKATIRPKENDTTEHRKWLLASAAEEQKQRGAITQSLQAPLTWPKHGGLIANFRTH